MRFSPLTRIVCASALLGAATLLTACGGGTYPNTGPTPLPTLAPTAGPTPTPGPVSATTALWFDVNATPAPQTFTVSEAGYGGTFAGSIGACTESPTGQAPATNAFIAEFASGLTTDAETPSAVGGSATFTIIAGLETGTCTVTVTDTNNNSTSVAVNVSAASLSVFGKHRK